MTEKVWFITGSSRGLGREWAIAALDRGDKVATTARSIDSVADLAETYGNSVLPIALDVADRAAAFRAVAKAKEHFGRIDVVVNNAGYGIFGMIEEMTEAQARALFDTNVFGALWVTQAALPVLRAQGGGHIVQVSSIGGITAIGNVAWYDASKWALEAMSQGLADEVAEHGITVTLVEPGNYATEWAGVSAEHTTPMREYTAFRRRTAEKFASMTYGEPSATRSAILKVVDAPNPPLRLFFGIGPLEIAKTRYAERIAMWEEWHHLSVEAQGRTTSRT